MPNCVRQRLPGASIFFTLRIADPGSELLIRDVAALRAAFHRTLAERPCRIDAIVVLPDHLHAVLTLPPGEVDYTARWRLIKARFSRSQPILLSRSGDVRRQGRGIWQRRFRERHLRDRDDYAAHLRYCWQDPVRHGLAARAEDWPYSSLHRDLRSRGRHPLA